MKRTTSVQNYLQYTIIKNTLIKNEDVGRAVPCKVYYLTDSLFYSKIAAKLNIEVEEVENLCKVIGEVVGDELQNGHGIKTSLLRVTPSISGKVSPAIERILYPKQKVVHNVTLGPLVSVDVSQIKTQKVENKNNSVHVNSAEDGFSETFGEKLTPNGTLVLTGRNLHFNPDKEDEGVFILRKGEEVKSTKSYLNTNNLLQIRIPELKVATGYRVAVRKRFYNNSQLFTHVLSYLFNVE